MGPGMMGPMRGGGVAGLLFRRNVQEELKLSEDQLEQLRALGEKMREQGGDVMREAMEKLGGREALRELEPEERRAKFEKMMEEFRPEMEKRAKEMEDQIAEILEGPQFKRLKQIEVQLQGIDALVRDDIIQALELTEAQQKEIKGILEERNSKRQELGEQMRGAFQGGFRDMSEQERAQTREKMGQMRAKGEAINNEAQKKAMGVLTDDQKAKLPNLMGEPFEFRRPGEGRPGEGRRRDGRRGGDRPRRPRSE